jgi:hypothetical protein
MTKKMMKRSVMAAPVTMPRMGDMGSSPSEAATREKANGAYTGCST